MTTEIPWGRLLAWPDVQVVERHLTLTADVEQRTTIAKDLVLEGLAKLCGDLKLKPWLDGVEINARITADLTRLCGVSLEPFDVAIDERVRIRIVPTGSPNAPAPESAEVIVDLEGDDPPDEAIDGVIDLTAYVVESLALALDPFPRKPGAVFTQPESTGPISPFAVLSSLGKRIK